MRKLKQTTLVGLLLLCPLYTFAGAELDQVNAEVEAKAAQIDLTHGVLLTGQERNSLKIKLVAGKVTKTLAEDETATISDKVDEAIETYDISDPIDQRQLLIEIQSIEGFDGDGLEPPQ